MDLKLSGKTIVSMLHEYTIIFRTNDGCSINVESLFELSWPGVQKTIDPEANENTEWRDQVLQQVITASNADDDGTLRLEFANATTLKCPFDPDYEAWHTSGPGYNMVVCMPGGEYAIWGYQDQP
jgi:hypothetical protein